MMRAHWEKVRAEWRSSRRLRVGTLVALMVVGTHLLLVLGDQRQAMVDAYTSDLELRARMEAVAREGEWPERAERAETAYAALVGAMPLVTGPGLARAELQNWLTQFAASAGVGEPRIRIEDSLAVPGHPGVWQVLARLDGQIQQYGQGPLARSLSEALPWIQVERLEIAEGAPARISVVVRGFYRQDDSARTDEASAEQEQVQ